MSATPPSGGGGGCWLPDGCGFDEIVVWAVIIAVTCCCGCGCAWAAARRWCPQCLPDCGPATSSTSPWAAQDEVRRARGELRDRDDDPVAVGATGAAAVAVAAAVGTPMAQEGQGAEHKQGDARHAA